ncbi:13800_t:CDS:10 [Funneliformis caledonium]|uniref:13800_t:CDS:1 n=1 Tax=Funneliformis caledonium TaxID=1117310 RepID=A0A9N8ZAQ5_9GLOM|nr:13800_t:CDS:10 [Funneliformis caledonium]
MPYINKYFERKPSNWDILDFLNEWTFNVSVIQAFNASHEVRFGASQTSQEQPVVNVKNINYQNLHCQGSQPDRVRYQKWEKERASCEKARTVSEESKNTEFATSSRPKKRNKNDYEFDTDGSVSDDKLLPITSSVTSKKLSKIGKGIARYGVIFLPECHKNDILRSEFSDYEWRNLENIFRKKDEEISAQTSPPLDKVERILKEYNESIKKATEGAYVDLDAIFFVPNYKTEYKFRKHWLSKWVDNVYQKFVTCFQLSKHVLNDKSTSEYQYRSWFVNLLCEDIFLDVNNVIRFVTGEVENIDRKNQKDLSKLPEERRPIGWYHDGILNININGNDLQVGFLEVVGNAIIEDHIKRVGDLQKILKAMRLAFFQLEESLREKGVDDEKKLKQKLETFGILVDRRDFAFYVMNYYDRAFLVDEIFFIYNTGHTNATISVREYHRRSISLQGKIFFTHLNHNLFHKQARTEYLNTRINELLRDATSRRRSRRTMTAVDASPQKAEKTRKSNSIK